jgi:hypothetical protein
MEVIEDFFEVMEVFNVAELDLTWFQLVSDQPHLTYNEKVRTFNKRGGRWTDHVVRNFSSQYGIVWRKILMNDEILTVYGL